MKAKSTQLKIRLYSLVFIMALLALGAVFLGWYTMGSQAGALSYAFPAIAALVVILAVITLSLLSRRLIQPLTQIGEHFDRISVGDLTQRIDVAGQDEIGHLYAAVKRLQDNLGRSVGSVRAGLEQISRGTQEIVAGNADLSSRTEQQAASLQQTAASMEQLASTVKQNADNARQANQLAATASEVAQRGGQAVGEVVSTMEGISASSRKIADIVGVIDSIAFQTNILALNAAVEAARAGEQGKGFAVVASEVRALAQRSAHAAKEIKDLIDDSVKKVSEGSQQVERAGATMQEIVSSVARVTDIMGEISAATTEQSSGIDQINMAVTQMDGVTQQNAALVEQAARSVSELRDQVSQVNGAMSVYRLSGPSGKVIDVTNTASANASPREVKPAARASSASAAGAPRVAAPALKPAKPAAIPASKPAAAQTAEDDWEEF